MITDSATMDSVGMTYFLLPCSFLAMKGIESVGGRFDRDQISWGLIVRGGKQQEIGALPMARFADGRDGLDAIRFNCGLSPAE